MYEINSNSVEQITLELVLLIRKMGTEKRMRMHDLPTPLLPMNRIFKLYALNESSVTNLNAWTCIIEYQLNL